MKKKAERKLGKNISLLANELAIGPLLMFLKKTKVGSREGAVEKKVEWESRRDREGENRLRD